MQQCFLKTVFLMGLFFYVDAVPDRLNNHYDPGILNSFGSLLIGASVFVASKGYDCFQDQTNCRLLPLVDYLVASVTAATFFVSGCGLLLLSNKVQIALLEPQYPINPDIIEQLHNNQIVDEFQLTHGS